MVKRTAFGGLLIAGALALAGCVSRPLVVGDAVVASSPDGRNEIRLYQNPVAYEVLRDGVVVVGRTAIGLKVNGDCLVREAVLGAVEGRRLSGKVATPVYKKSEVSLAAYETFADFGSFGIRLIARDDGVAYRFETKFPGSVIVDAEMAGLTIPDRTAQVWSCFTGNLGCEETVPETYRAGEIDWRGRAAYLPFVYTTGGKCVAAVESNVHDYPIWNLTIGDNMPDAARIAVDSTFAKADGGKDYLAETDGTRVFPWRAFVLADEPAALCENDVVFALATPADERADWSWVKPGKVAWDWWNDFNFGPDHPDEGLNTAGYHHYIDFAAANGIEYVILDAGWSGETIWTYNPNVDVPEIIEYGRHKGVGIILWMHWTAAYLHEAEIASHYAKLGAKGFKVDFMDRGDELVANFLEKFAGECAKNRMMVDYHGVYRPVGLNRTYPNIVNYEGIHGLEQMKWFGGYDFMANDVRQFFIRFTAGQADYTPGAMLNYPIGQYGGDWHTPGSIGTRVHQMALMTLYFAPLQMLCDNPVQYEKEPECTAFMAAVPTVWERTVALGGTPDTMAAVARRADGGKVWYASGVTNAESRDFTFATGFLGRGTWTAEIFRDAPESDAEPRKYIHETRTLRAGEELSFHMACGGGFVVRFSK